MTTNSKIKKDDIRPVDLAIGSGMITGGVIFLVLILTQGSSSKIVRDIKKEVKNWGSKIL